MTPPTEPDARLVLGRYRLTDRLAAGGSAQVWRARDEQLDRDVAVKLLHPHLLPDARSRARLTTEARAAAGLAHPGIVAVYDVDASGDAPCIVLELVTGETLAARLAREGRLPEREAARIAAEVAEALFHAHQRGVIHRDVTPGNILIERDGRARIVDFGIARMLDEAAERLTMTGTVMGTLRYMAPEQLVGDETGPRTDLWGLGAVLWHMLSGSVPFDATTAVALAEAQRAGPGELPDVDPVLRAIAAACLALDPTDRPRHAGAVAAALRAWLAGEAGPLHLLAPAGAVDAEAETAALPTVPAASASAAPAAPDRPSPAAPAAGMPPSGDRASWPLLVAAAGVVLLAILVLVNGPHAAAGPSGGATPSVSQTATPSASPTPTVVPTVDIGSLPKPVRDQVEAYREACGADAAAAGRPRVDEQAPGGGVLPAADQGLRRRGLSEEPGAARPTVVTACVTNDLPARRRPHWPTAPPRLRLVGLEEEGDDLAALHAEVGLHVHGRHAGAHDGHLGDVAAAHVAAVIGEHPEAVAGAHEPPADLVATAQVGPLVRAGHADAEHGMLGEELDGLLAAVVVDELEEQVDGAGQRAADIRNPDGSADPACRVLQEPLIRLTRGGKPGPAVVDVPSWSVFQQQADKSNFDPELGLLASQLAAHGVCATAIGPGAAIALADAAGRTAAYLPGTDLTSAIGAAEQRCPLTVVDAGGVRGPDDLLAGEPSNHIPEASQLAAVDRIVGQVLGSTPTSTTVLLVGLADSGRVPHLRLVAMRGNGFGPGVLYAPSTRQAGLVQLTDITPTILAQLGIAVPESLGGSPLVRQAGSTTSVAERRRGLLDYDEAAQEVHTAVPRFFTGLVVAQLLLYGFAALALRRRWNGESGRERTLRAVRRVALLFAAVPVSTFVANIVPWWRGGHPILTLTAAVAASPSRSSRSPASGRGGSARSATSASSRP